MRRITLFVAFVLCAGALPTGRVTAASRPKLIVGILIDQFRNDYLGRFGDLFGEGGFRRLLEEGAVFSDAQQLHATTVSSVGHATFMTGSIPTYHGIIGNQWFERAEGKVISSVDDEDVQPVGSATGQHSSPHRLIGSTLGDELKLSNAGTSRVIGVSIKDSSAILTSGHHPDGAYWFDNATGKFVTSSYYKTRLPEWVNRFNDKKIPSRFFGQWQKLRPETDYDRSGVDDSPYEHPGRGNRAFPHSIRNYTELLETPFGNDLLVAFAKAAVEGENLGKHDAPDLLTISFSSNDEVGHEYGPYSHEMEDITLRTDVVLADLFHYLDENIGHDDYVIVLTADHGVAPSPDQAKAMGLGGGRFSEAGAADFISSALNERYGPGKWIAALTEGNLYLDSSLASRQHVSFIDLTRAAALAALALPQFAAAYTSDDFKSGNFRHDAISQRVAMTFFNGRSGDVVLIPKPYWVASDKTTNHGAPYNYDTSVPLIFWGISFLPGHFATAASPADIAPTLASILHITPPSGAIGRVLNEVLR